MQHKEQEPPKLSMLRRLLRLLFLMGMLGSGAELLLMDHTEEFTQLIPLLLMGLGVIVLIWYTFAPTKASILSFQGTMLLFILSGFWGLVFHYQANAEFAMELYQAFEGFDLFWEAIRGTTPPTLAPGTMILLGLLGLASTFGHPAVSKPQ